MTGLYTVNEPLCRVDQRALDAGKTHESLQCAQAIVTVAFQSALHNSGVGHSGRAHQLHRCFTGFIIGLVLPFAARAEGAQSEEAQTEKALLDRIRENLLQAKSARTIIPQGNDEEVLMESFQLITAKPVLYVCNVDESSAENGNKYVDQVRELVKDEDAEVIILSVGAEADITELESYEERQVFLEDMGLTEPGASVLIRAAYKLLKQQTYFTAGVKEVRAWTINIGSTAPQAAGVIHTDFEKGFIRAEVISYEDYVQYGSEAKAKEAGKFKVEGKEYIVKDGDVMHFRFNV